MLFEQPSYLFLIGLIPIYFFLLAWISKKNKQLLARLGKQAMVEKLILNYDEKLVFWQKNIYALAFFFLIIGIANPKWGEKGEEVQVKQSDVIIALDISQSMLCDDVKPNRLEKAKQFAEQLIEKIKAERIGIIVFAGEAYVQMPLTTDYKAASLFIQSANTNIAPTQGTAISEAIKLSEELRKDSKNPCALILLTDGENHDDDAISAAKEAKNQDLSFFVVGIGTSEGGFIPVPNNMFEMVKKDETGQPIRTKMNPEALKAIAQASDGEYSNISDFDASKLKNWAEKIVAKGEDTSKKMSYRNKESHFQWFLGIALLLLMIAYFLPQIKIKR
jgi:Ca-activated chloride channel homolog